MKFDKPEITALLVNVWVNGGRQEERKANILHS